MALPVESAPESTPHVLLQPGLEPQALFRLLIESVAAAPEEGAPRPFRRTDDGQEIVILATTIDDVQYHLVRTQPEPGARISLSPRELAIARLVAKGLPNKSIGDLLEISPWTVATHLRRIFSKLEVTTRAAMIARLVEEQLLVL